MKKVIVLLLFVFIGLQYILAQTPVLGTYPNATINTVGGNASVIPSGAPATTLSITASTSTNFKGLLHVDPVTGIVKVTNAHPAGSYVVKLTAFNGLANANATFNLTVGNSVCGNFNNGTVVAVGAQPRAVAIADFNNDGHQDFATANGITNSASIRLGNGSGGFITKPDVTVGSTAWAIAVGDFNGDGNQDFATANFHSQNVSIRLGDGTGGFTGTTAITVGKFVKSIAIGDFNGDGKQDFATADSLVSIRLGDGNGGFSGTGSVSTGVSPFNVYGVAVGDFNNDNKQDIATANHNGTVSVRLGDGMGNFTGTLNVQVGGPCGAIVTGDFNNDGNQDFATANSGNATVSLCLGNGLGGFGAATTISVMNSPESFAAADFNGDGNLDIITTNTPSGNLSICHGNGAGGLSIGAILDGAESPLSIAVGNFNGDGNIDIVYSSASNYATVRLGGLHEINVTGNNTSIIDGDTTPDLTDFTDFGNVTGSLTRTFSIENTGTANLAINNLEKTGTDAASFTIGGLSVPTVILPGASRTFTVTATPLSNGLNTATVRIFNDDCNEALYDFSIQATGIVPTPTLGSYPNTQIVANSNSNVLPNSAPANTINITATTSTGFKGSLLVNPATGVLTITNAHPAGTYTIKIKAINGIHTADTNFQLTVLKNICSQGTFGPPTYNAVFNGPEHVAIADFNGDGKQDFVTANRNSGDVAIRLGNGLGGFTAGNNFTVGSSPRSITTGDFNGDGKQDIAVANYGSNNVSVGLGNGFGGFTIPTQATVTVGTNPAAISSGDFNGDGKVDLVTANAGSNTVSVRLGDGTGNFFGNTDIMVAVNPISIAIGDFNGDLKPDIATANYNSNTASILLGNGFGSFVLTTNIAIGGGPNSIATGDFNSDGIQDLAVTHSVSNGSQVAIRFGNGMGSFTGDTFILNGVVGNSYVTVGDFNGDGKPDVATANYSGSTIYFAMGNGLGGFTGITPYISSLYPTSVAAGDFNGDGRQDIVVTLKNANNVDVYLSGVNEINLQGNATTIADGDDTPSHTDHTDFGNVSTSFTRIFTIQNTGNKNLVVNDIKIAGADSSMFSLAGIILPATLSAGTATTFSVKFIPASTGLKAATINILSDDCDEGVYNFAIQGTGLPIVPVLGAYQDTAVKAGSNTVIIPASLPVNSLAMSAMVSAGFKGNIIVDTATGVVRITNAYPAGNYTVTVKAKNGFSSATANFLLTVKTPLCSQGLFAGTNVVAAKSNPRAFAIGDFNKDGNQDMAIANSSSSNVSIRLGDGTGGFSGSTDIVVGGSPSSIVTGDFNSDGQQDFATANQVGNSVSVCLGNGAGVFSPATTTAVDNSPWTIVAADFNGDGKLDIVTANGSRNTVSICLGNGDGAFSTTRNIAVAGDVYSLVAGDFNKDGNQDIITIDFSGRKIISLSGNGVGDFVISVAGATGIQPRSISTADFNGDGNEDLAIGNDFDKSVFIRFGDGNGGFSGSTNLSITGSPYHLATGDFNGDGYQDFATANYLGNTVSTYFGYGTGLFYSAPNITITSNPIFLGIGDFNNDGIHDFAAANFAGASVSVRTGRPDIADIMVQGNQANIAIGDNTPSVSDHTDFGSVSTSLTRTYSIQNPSSVPLTVTSIFVTGADAALFAKGGIALPAIISPGALLTFTIAFTPNAGGLKTARVIINNNDCDKASYDFAIQATGSGLLPGLGMYSSVTTLTGANAIIIPSGPPSNASGITAITSTNFKGLLHIDSLTGKVIVTNPHPAGIYNVTVRAVGITPVTATFTLTVNNPVCSKALFQPTATTTSLLSRSSYIALGDFNGDGKQDYVSDNYLTNDVAIGLGNGSGSITSTGYIALPASTRSVAVADLNGDGRQDIIAAHYKGNSVSIVLGNGAGGSSSVSNILVGDNPLSVAIADCNNDGKQDIIVANSGSKNVSVLLGNGSGSFFLAQTIVLPTAPNAIVAGDFDADGKVDFATANGAGNTVSVRLGNGLGGFSGSTELTTGTNPQSLIIGDFNSDGLPDIAAANAGSNSVSIRLGNGTGGFTGATEISVGLSPTTIALGDFNGDGKQDIITGSNIGSNISLNVGDGSGGFGGTTNIAMGTGPRSLIVGDFNADGKQDITAANDGPYTISTKLAIGSDIHLQGNDTTIIDGSTAPVIANHTDFGTIINGTSLPRKFFIQNTGTDSLAISTISIGGSDAPQFTVSGITLPVKLAIGASTSFTVQFSANNSIGLKTAVVNISSDDCDEGLYDYLIHTLVVAPPVLGAYPATVIATAGGSATVTPSAAPSSATALTAFTTSSFKGLLHVNPVTGNLSISNAHPAGTYTINVGTAATSISSFVLTVNNTACSQGLFKAGKNVATGSGPQAVVVGDFNGDVKQDIATVNDSSNAVSIALGDGLGDFTSAAPVTVGAKPRALAIADFNGDGKQDFATANYGSNNVSIRLGDGAGGFTGNTFVAVGTNPNSIAVSDFNGDGRQDFATTNSGSNDLSIRLGDGLGGFYGSYSMVAPNPVSVVTGDFNNDGKPDIAFANLNATVYIRLGDGLGGFTAAGDVGVHYDPRTIVVADFNADGKQDIAVANRSASTISIRLGNGLGSFSASANIAVGTSPESLIIGDFNGDGKIDIVTANALFKSFSMLLGNGLGGFTGTNNNIALPYTATSVATGDFDGDGSQDLAFANYKNRNIVTRLGSTGEIDLLGNNVSISDGSDTPSASNGTDFGNVGTKLTRDFTIKNNGPVTLTVTDIVVAGVDAPMFTTSGLNLPDSIATGDSVIFHVSFLPTSSGNKTAVITIVNDDCNEANYDFTVQGNGVPTVTTIGSYNATTVANAGSNVVVIPSIPPANSAAITATASPHFKGMLSADPNTGAVTITNAHPAGIYTVTVRSFNGFSMASSVFSLTVNNSVCSKALFAGFPNISSGKSPKMVVAGDFNRDGNQDMAIANSDSNVSIKLGNGNGTFYGLNKITFSGQPTAIAIGDFNGDGKQDIATIFSGGTSMAIRLGDGLGNFSGTEKIVVPTGCNALEIADLNNDGRQDIAVANNSTNLVYICIGNGLGGFNIVSSVAVGSRPNSIALADFNGDGKQDIATANNLGSNTSIRFGDGLGGFTGNTTLATGSGPYSIIAADFNKDGFQDLAIANISSSNIAIWLGNGAGGFTSATNISVGVMPVVVVAGDFNGDGVPDLLSLATNNNIVNVLIGNGAGNFTNIGSIAVGARPLGACIGDFNNDGRQDFAVMNESGNSVSVNLGGVGKLNISGNNIPIANGDNTPSFADSTDYGSTSSQLLRSFKIKNTGLVRLELNKLSISGADSAMFTLAGAALPSSLGAGDSTNFTIRFLPTSSGSKTAVINILNSNCEDSVFNFTVQGTGVPALPTLGIYTATAIVKTGGNIAITPSVPPSNAVSITAFANANFKGTLHINPSTGILSVTNARPAGSYDIKIITVNGFASSQTTCTLIVTGAGCTQGLLTSLPVVILDKNALQIAIGDFNSDGKQDFITANPDDSTVSVRLGNGAGGFGGSAVIKSGSGTRGITIADFNGDGKQDFATANYGRTSASIRLGDGLGGFNGTTEISVAGNARALTSADFNNDGKTDLAVANFVGASVSIRLGNGLGDFAGNVNVPVGNGPYAIVTGDFNADGNIDFATANYSSGSVSVRLGDGTGAFGGTTELTAGTNPYAIATGEFNGDGNQDLAIANYGNNTISIRLGNGSGLFTTAPDLSAGGRPASISVADFNGDGNQDIAVPCDNSSKVVIKHGNGAGAFLNTAEIPVVSGPSGLAAGDFDADGKQDFATVSYSTSGLVSVRMGGGIEIEVSGNNKIIYDGDSTAELADFTDFAGVVTGDSAIHHFTIFNKGNLADTIRNFKFSGSDSALFYVSGVSTPLVVLPGATRPFSIVFTARDTGIRKAVLHIINDDCDESSYDISLQGNSIALPVIGSYPATVMAKSNGGATVMPSIAPTGAVNLYVSTSAKFKGLLTADPVTGIIKISNAYPAGTYVVKVGVASVTTTFILTVGPPVCSKGTFRTSPNTTSGLRHVAVASGDFNGDGKQDIATANYNVSSVSIRLGDNMGVFGSEMLVSVKNSPLAIAVADFNGDGKQDIITGNYNAVSVRLYNGDSVITGGYDEILSGSADAIATGDFNSDGKMDFIATTGSNMVMVRLGDGKGSFFKGQNILLTLVAQTLSVTDFNNDGKQDIVTGNYSSLNSSAAVCLGDGGGIFAITEIATGKNPRGVATADFNSDGNQDFALSNLDSDSVSIKWGNGAGGFTGNTSIKVGRDPYSIITGDFNADGKPDFATANFAGASISIRLNDGMGGFINKADNVLGLSPKGLATGDFNNDGRPDIIAANSNTSSSNRLSLLLNSIGEINLRGNNVDIPNNSSSPLLSNHTDFGVVPPGSTSMRTFVIQNTGADSLLINNIRILGVDAALFTLSGIVLPVKIPAGTADTIFINYAPLSVGLKSATVNVLINDCDEAIYRFAIQGADKVAGDALQFDGIDDYVNINNHTGNINTGYATISARVKTNAVTPATILSKGDGCSPGSFFNFGVSASGKLTVEFATNGVANQAITGNVVINDGLWHHVAAVRKDSLLYLYVDGRLDTSKTSPAIAAVSNTAPLLIGASGCSGTSNFFKGEIDEIRFWNVALSSLAMQTSLQCELGNDHAGLLAFYKFNQGLAEENNITVTTLKDSSGNGNNGLLNNFTLNGSTSNWLNPAGHTSISCKIENIWLGTTSDWGMAGNWSMGYVPNEETAVVINTGVPFMPQIADPEAVCNSLRLNNGAALTVKGSGKLNIAGKN
ncbi:MAG: FG-GAP-like repeat-containing protein [Bacteroidota bacterium]